MTLLWFFCDRGTDSVPFALFIHLLLDSRRNRRMTQRPHCQICLYPLSTCICCAVAPVKSMANVDILQHPSEQKAAKNTARLVTLCMPKARVWMGEQADDFTELQSQLATEARPIVVVYPAAGSLPLEAFIKQQEKTQQPALALRLLFLDGTWKKAYKLWQLNPWLQQYPQISIETTTSQYHIRKAPKAHYLSTLEAVAICLQKAEHCNVQPLYDCLHQMQLSFSQHMR
ncbi:tRNA-uridine aminocarboxypropyltransferase [Marinagarivorans cellulosilyticus]|uniref:tRNA-uridine aminocarboxypropyltransferase n=1 Tax=Marinagarivorans cellulosilyticus TaxID=2721545 RepID=A0AAN1WGV8_9GAMM|nr:hypothetical protein MARGE09_P1564 [Marinagarivorans cellulosilyticus]